MQVDLAEDGGGRLVEPSHFGRSIGVELGNDRGAYWGGLEVWLFDQSRAGRHTAPCVVGALPCRVPTALALPGGATGASPKLMNSARSTLADWFASLSPRAKSKLASEGLTSPGTRAANQVKCGDRCSDHCGKKRLSKQPTAVNSRTQRVSRRLFGEPVYGWRVR
jgi:hypothetical protein